MQRAQALEELRAALRVGDAAALMARQYHLRHHDRATFAALFTRTRFDGAKADYTSVQLDPEPADPSVARREILDWITPSLPPIAVRMMAYLLSLDDPSPMTRDEFVRAVAERAPGLAAVAAESLCTGSQRALRAFAAIEPVVATALRDATRAGLPLSPSYDALSPAARAVAAEGWLDASEAPTAHRVRDLSHASAYPRLLERVVGALSKRDAENFWADLSPLDADAIERLLRAVRTKEAQFERVAFLAAHTSSPAAAEGLSRLLGDAARGRSCARWLSLMGPIGRDALTAAATRASERTRADERVRALCAEALAIPGAPAMFVALGNQPSGWNLDPRRFLEASPPPPSQGDAPRAPTPLDALSRVINASAPRRDDLSPEGWADLLQFTAISGWQDDREAAYELAIAQNRLGWGPDPGRLYDALDRFDFDQQLSTSASGSGLSLGHVLLGLNAPNALWLHALAILASRTRPVSLGVTDRNFSAPLKAWGHPDAERISALALHLDLARAHAIGADELSRYPTLESASELVGEWTSSEHHADLRLRATVSGASRVTIKARESLEFSVDLATQRWSQRGVDGPSEGDTTLFGGERVVQLDLELVAASARFAVNGTHILGGPKGHLFENVPSRRAPVSIETDGRIARVTLTAMLGLRAAQDAVSLAGFGELKSLNDVLHGADEVAAHALAVTARFAAAEETRSAAERALREAGDFADAWRDALGITRAEARAEQRAPVTFAACVKRFEALKSPERVKIAEGVAGFAKAAAVNNPAKPKWAHGAISEDTLYLVEGGGWRAEGVTSAKALLGTSMPAITTWNSRGTGAWAGVEGEWILLVCDDLAQEQDEWETMSLTLAAWRVDDGVAYAAWKSDAGSLANVMGLPSGLPPRAEWTSIEVWIGE